MIGATQFLLREVKYRGLKGPVIGGTSGIVCRVLQPLLVIFSDPQMS